MREPQKMSDPEGTVTGEEEESSQQDRAIGFQEFLEKAHPSVEKEVVNFWEAIGLTNARRRKVNYIPVRLHCRTCEGPRTFRTLTDNSISWESRTVNAHPLYRCGDCLQDLKHYALRITFGDHGGGKVYKYGEEPPFGVPVPNRVLRLFGKDGKLFLKGRQCESQGFGIAAFAYYRRVVENHKNDLFDEIIKVCQTLNESAELIDQLKAAKRQISFTASIDEIKTALPQGLLIDGHNPLNALHGALSVGLHSESDEDCLQNAQAIRFVLSDLVERIAMLKQDNKELSVAVQRLLAKKKGATD